jgi:hypothetical protein
VNVEETGNISLEGFRRPMNTATHLRFVNCAEPGFYADERIVLRPSARINLMEYVLLPMKSVGRPNDAEDLNTDVYWFPDKEVQAGDYVLLYSKSGTDHSFTNSNGHEVHVFYWNKERAVWRNGADVVAVLRVTDWVFYDASSPALEKAS